MEIQYYENRNSDPNIHLQILLVIFCGVKSEEMIWLELVLEINKLTG